MRKTQLLISGLLLLLLLAACAPTAAPAPTVAPTPMAVPAAPARSAPQTAAKEAWQVKWDKMVEDGKREGGVLVYITEGARVRAALQIAFKKSFGINAEFISGQGAELATKVLAERRAGLRLGDVGMVGGSAAMLQLKPAGLIEPLEVGGVLILPEFSDPNLWWRGGIQWQDPPTHTSVEFAMWEMQNLVRNTELVKEGEIQSYSDLLNPKWNGKIVMRDPTKAGGGSKPIAMVGRYSMGWDFVRALVKQDPLIITDLRLQMEWVARGKYAIAYGYRPSEYYTFRELGMPVAVLRLREGGHLSAGGNIVTLLKNAPHPNAARLFINWLLTKEGQTSWSQSTGYPSTRLDISDEGLPDPRPDPKTKAPNADSEESLLKQAEDMKIIKEIFAPLIK